MVDDPPSLEPPTARKRLIDTFGPIDTWGEHGPEAMQAILDALDTETVPAVDSLDALENISDTDIPYVIKGNDQSPGELSDQAIPTGKQLKSLSEAVSNQVESVANAKLDSVESINDISEPADDDRFYVAELGATVKYDESSDSYGLESVPVVSTADELDEFDTSGIPHVIAGNETAPEELSDQVVSTGAHLKAVLNSVTSEIDSITDAKLTSVESVSDISEPADN